MNHTPVNNAQNPQKLVRVLVVEHEASDVEITLWTLRRAGLHVHADVVASPEEFLARVNHNDYDIVLADYRLPGWSALEVLELLHRHSKEIPVLLITGTLGEEAAVDCIKRGMTDYILKGNLSRLPIAVQRALEEKALREERARAEEALRESEASFRLLFAHNPLPMWVFDIESLCFLQVNDAAIAHYGYTREEFLSRKVTDFRPPGDTIRPFEEFVQRPGVVRFTGQTRHVLKNGQIMAVDIALHRLEFGGRGAALVVAQDVTERQRAEEALRGSEERFRSLSESSPSGVFQTDLAGRCLYTNACWQRMAGLTLGESLGDGWLQAVHPEDRPAVLAEWERSVAQGREYFQEHRFLTPKGEERWVSARAAPIHSESGQIIGFVGTQEDVTERRSMEKRLRQMQKFEAIGQLAGGIAHDFNNVIGAILGWAELGQEQAPPDSHLHNHFRHIREQAERAAGLTRQLLAFARRQILEPRNIDLNQIIVDLVSLLENVIGKHIELSTVLAPSLGVVRADPTQIEQVLMNLCLNARDAMPAGGTLAIQTQDVELGEDFCRLYEYVQPGRYVLLSVADTGVGMDALTIEHIFEPFFTTKEPGKGTGLGLATVYGVAKQHGGFVQVQSELGRGSTFQFYLPVSGGEPTHEN